MLPLPPAVSLLPVAAFPQIGVEQLSFSDCIYFLTVTFSTVGFGDIAPGNTAGRVVAMMLMLLGNCTLLMGIAEIAAALTGARDDLLRRTQATMLQVGLGHSNYAKQQESAFDENALSNMDPDIANVSPTLPRAPHGFVCLFFAFCLFVGGCSDRESK